MALLMVALWKQASVPRQPDEKRRASQPANCGEEEAV